MVDLLSHPPTQVIHILEFLSITNDEWKDMYVIDPCLREV
jgi:hypothetical protein